MGGWRWSADGKLRVTEARWRTGRGTPVTPDGHTTSGENVWSHRDKTRSATAPPT